MAGDIFVKAQEEDTLETFVRRVANLFNLAHVERRESSSYVDEEYYRGIALSLEVTFARADEPDVHGYDFWINLGPSDPWVEDPSFLDGLADLLARRMTIAGESVMRLRRSQRKGARNVFYTLSVGALHASRDQVVTTEG
jgi:hypothetical protein